MALWVPEKWIGYINIFNEFIPNKVLLSFIILIIGLVAAKVIQIFATKIAEKLTAKTKTNVDDMVINKTKRPLFYILILIVLQLALQPLEARALFFERFIDSLIIILIVYTVIIIFDIVIDIWGYGFAARTKSTIDEAVLPLLHKFSKVFFVIIGLLFILDEWEVEISPVLASLGIAGLAVAFALQNTLGNIFAGISIVLDKTIKVGDRINIEGGPAGGTVGEVLDIGLRSTKIRTFDNEVVIIPNGKLAESQIQNLVLPTPAARVGVEFGVEYGSDPKKVERVVLDIIKKLDTLRDENKKPAVWFLEMGDFALKFKAVFWVESYKEKFMAKIDATTKIYEALRKNNIGIPFPTRTVYMHKAK